MANKKKQKMSARRKASAAIAGVLALTLVLGGAYAWTDYSQSQTNRFVGFTNPYEILHDEFIQN